MENKSKEQKDCNCKTKYCSHFTSDFDNFCKDNPLSTPPESWEEEFDNKFVEHNPRHNFNSFKDLIVEQGDQGEVIDNIKSFITQTLSTEKAKWMKEWREKIIGMVVKNSTGFDTISDQRLWHLDIDKFESEFNNLLTTPSEQEER